MRGFNRFYFAAVILAFMHQSSEALASRIPSIKQLPRFRSRLLAMAEPTEFGSTPSPSSAALVPLQRFPSKMGARKSPLFSSASSAAAPAGLLSSVSSPLKRGLLGFRGGSTGFAVTKLAKSLLDDVAASKTKCWAVLVISILLETTASTLSKKARDTSNPGLFLFSISLNLISLCGFCTALAKLDVGVAYAIWAALGTVIVTAAGVIFFQEAMDPLKMISIVLVILGVIGLNLSGSH